MKDVNRSKDAPRSYAAPTVTVYGSVLELTASGTGAQNENGGATGQTVRRP